MKRKWTAGDIRFLRKAYHMKVSLGAAAADLGRTVRACQNKAREENLVTPFRWQEGIGPTDPRTDALLARNVDKYIELLGAA